MDSPFTRGVHDSPYLRAQEAKHTSSFSLGPGMHESHDGSSAADTPQSTADLTAFVQNLLQQMQSRFQSMSDAILVRIDEMASRIEEMERAVDEVLREVKTADEDQGAELPSPSSSPIRRTLQAPLSPSRTYSTGSPGPVAAASHTGRYPSAGAAPDVRQLVSSTTLIAPNSPDLRRHSISSSYVPGSPGARRLSLPGSYVPPVADSRKPPPSLLPNTDFPSSPDNRRRSDTYASGTHLR